MICCTITQPTASLQADPMSGVAPLDVTFDISGSSDPKGAIVNFELQFGDGSPPATGQDLTNPITHTYSDDGYYTAVLVIANARDLTGHAKAHINVTNPGPQAGFTYSPDEPGMGESVSFDACGHSVDPARLGITPQSIITYELDFGDGFQAFSQGCTISHTYTNSGTYTVVLAIYDDDGVRDTHSQTIAIELTGFYIYVANSSDDTVSVIRTADNTVIGSPIDVDNHPEGIAITPDGSYAYVVNSHDDTVRVIRTSDNTVVDIITVDNHPWGVAITPSGNYAYVPNTANNTVSVIWTFDNTVVSTVSVGGDPRGIAITPDGKHAYVVNTNDHTVSVIETLNNTVVFTVSVGLDPWGIAITPDGDYAYVVNSSDNTVSVIETLNNTVVGSPIAVGAVPYDVSITPDGDYAYVVNSSDNTVSVIRTSDNTVDGFPITVGVEPERIAITPDGEHAYVSNQGGNTVSVIRTSDNTVVETITVGNSPTGIAIRPQ
jgi:YVTN family beta-propeller protein